MKRSLLLRAFCGALLIVLAPWVAAGGPAPATQTSESALAIAEIAQRAAIDEQFADAVQRRAEAASHGEDLTRRFKALRAAIERLNRALRPVQIDGLPLRRLESLKRHWQFLARDLARLRSELLAAIQPLSSDAEQLSARRRIWDATLALHERAFSPWTIRARQVSNRLAEAELALSKPSAALLELSQAAGQIDREIAAGLEQTRRLVRSRDRDLLRIDAQPLWSASRTRVKAGLDVLASQGLAIETAFAKDYDARFRQAHLAMILTLVGLLPLLIWISRRTRARARREHVPEATLVVLSRPVAAWIVLIAIAEFSFHWDGPVIRQQLALLIAWLPVLRLLPTIVRRALGPWAWISAVFYALDSATSLFAVDPLSYRYALAALASALVVALIWLALRHARHIEASAARGRTLWLLRGSAVLAAASLIANLVGSVSLAAVLLDGLLVATYVAVALCAVAAVVAALSDTLLRRSGAILPARVGARAGSLRRAAIALGGLMLAVVWLIATLSAFRILRPVLDAIHTVLGYQIAIGDVGFTIGNVVVFALVVWIARWLARTLRDLLAEDVLPNMALPRGVAHSVSSLSYYTLIGVGVLAALAISGVQMNQLALVIGALGVGVGLGLQDAVKNVVSGLILMVERPIQPGDVIELGGITGRVREIGLRATRLVTFEGADVVIPNGSMVSDRLINWTLSDGNRRIEVCVGVGYDSDPNQVLALLQEVAARTKGVLPDPKPVALFIGFGPSALDFTVRAWTREDADWVAIRSQMGLSVLQALREAGIAIPFPQQDVHLRSLAPEAAASLARSLSNTRPSTPPT